MSSSTFVSASAIGASDFALQTVATNLSNQLTDGFYRSDAILTNTVFQDSLGTAEGPAGRRQNQGIPSLQSGSGVYVAATMRDFRQGVADSTKNKYDLFVNGPGFVEVDMGNDVKGYTRALHLKTDSEGMLRLITDYPLTDEIKIDPGKYVSFIVGKEGKVLGIAPDGNQEEIGQISLVNFINPAGLRAHEDTLFTWTPEAGDPISGSPGDPGFGAIIQGSIERSNVDGPTELIRAAMIQKYSNANATALRIAQSKENEDVRQLSQISG